MHTTTTSAPIPAAVDSTSCMATLVGVDSQYEVHALVSSYVVVDRRAGVVVASASCDPCDSPSLGRAFAAMLAVASSLVTAEVAAL